MTTADLYATIAVLAEGRSHFTVVEFARAGVFAGELKRPLETCGTEPPHRKAGPPY